MVFIPCASLSISSSSFTPGRSCFVSKNWPFSPTACTAPLPGSSHKSLCCLKWTTNVTVPGISWGGCCCCRWWCWCCWNVCQFLYRAYVFMSLVHSQHFCNGNRLRTFALFLAFTIFSPRNFLLVLLLLAQLAWNDALFNVLRALLQLILSFSYKCHVGF